MFQINQTDMQKAMKKLGVRQEEIEAEEVIIRSGQRDIIIKNPQVLKVNMMGQETFQVSGELFEVDKSKAETEDDAATIMGQTGCTKEEALEALEESNGNLAEAILKLQEK